MLVCTLLILLPVQSFRSAARADGSPAERTVVLASGEWPPWTSATLPHFGIAGQIVRNAFAAAGYRAEIAFFPWSRAWAIAQAAPYVGTFPWIDMPQRHKVFLYSDSLYESRTVFFHRADDPLEWRDWPDLQGRRAGVTLGYAYGPAFERAVRNGYIEVDTAPTDEANFEKLLHGRIDVFPVDELVGLMLVRSMPAGAAARLTWHPRPVFVATNHLLIRRDAPRAEQLLADFNRGLRATRGGEVAAKARRRFLAAEH